MATISDDDLDIEQDEPRRTDDDDDIVARVKKARKDADTHLSKWREEAKEAFGFVSGDQWSEDEKAALLETMRQPVVFNRIAPMVDAVSGSEINNRQQVAYIPRQVGASGVNELLTGAADYIRDNCDAEDEESDAFLDAIICGVGCTETRLDYEDSAEGDIKIDRVDPMTMAWDPTARKRNLSDICWAQRESWMQPAEIKSRWPDKADEIDYITDDWALRDDGDGDEPHDASMAWLYRKNQTGYDSKTGELRVIHHQWQERETYWRVLDPSSGQVLEFPEERFARVRKLIKDGLMPHMQAVKRTRKTWLQAFVCGGTLLETGPAPIRNSCSFKFITAKRDRNKGLWYGIVRAMTDPQRWANKFFSQILRILDTNAKGGLMAEEDAVTNWRAFEEGWSQADSITKVRPGALSAGKVQPKPLAPFPTEINHLLSFSISSLRDVSGVNLEMLGLADREQAGVLEAQRKQAALGVLAGLFDGLRRYRKEQGRLLARFIREYLSDGRLVRIQRGNGLEEFVPLLRDQMTFEYDVVVDESPTSQNTKERTFAILAQMMPMLMKAQVPMPPDLLDYSPLPTGMVEKWKRYIQQSQQQGEQKPPDPQLLKVANDQERLNLERQVAQQDAIDKAEDRRLEWAKLSATVQAQQMRAMTPQPQPQ